MAGSVHGDVILIVDPDLLWQEISQRKPPADLRQATEQYPAYLVDRYRYLDFRGMGVSDCVPLRCALADLYVPLKARIELPEGHGRVTCGWSDVNSARMRRKPRDCA